MEKYSFAEHLLQHGPHAEKGSLAVDESFRYCRQLTHSHYENFSVISWLVPTFLRQHFANVYAFCRWSDDLADENLGDSPLNGPGGAPTNWNRMELLNWWRSELGTCFQDENQDSPRHPVMLALRVTIRKFNIPQQPFEHLIDAFEQDQTTNRYPSFEQLQQYCNKSANPVGKIVLHLGGNATAENIHLSDMICTGLQLANFWQDIARDHAIGRIYLPQESLQRFGYSEAEMIANRDHDTFRKILAFEIDRAEALLLKGAPLVEKIDRSISSSVELFVRGGLAILKAIRQQNYNVWSNRPRLSKIQKIRIIFRTLMPGSPLRSLAIAASQPPEAKEGTA